MQFTLEHIANTGHRETCMRASHSKGGDANISTGNNNTSGATNWSRNVDNFRAAERKLRTLKHACGENLLLNFYWCATPNEFPFYFTTDICNAVDGALAPFDFAWCASSYGRRGTRGSRPLGRRGPPATAPG